MTEFVTAPDGVRIAYEAVGEGAPVVLIHGFGSDRNLNWRGPGWYDALTKAGHAVLALDCRGHGESGKPHDIAMYDEQRMIWDVLSVMNAAGHARATVMGYSMGGYMTVRLMHEAPERVEEAIIAGVGGVYFTRDDGWRAMISGGDSGGRRYRTLPRAAYVPRFRRAAGKRPGGACCLHAFATAFSILRTACGTAHARIGGVRRRR